MGRIAGRGIEPGARGDVHQVQISGAVLREKNELRAAGPALLPAPGHYGAIAEIERDLQADDRLHAFLGEFLGEFESAEKIVAVGDRKGRHSVGERELGQFGNRHRPFAQRIGAVNVKMDEADIGRDGAAS